MNFGTSDLFTAEYVSKLLGKTTVFSTSQREDGGSSTSETGRALMTPDEVMHLSRDEELLFVDGLRPIRAQKLPYFHTNLKDRAMPNPMMGEDADQAV